MAMVTAGTTMSTDSKQATADYQRLKQTLNKYAVGAPDTPNLDKILLLLFTPDEAAVAACMDFTPRDAETLSRLCSRDADVTSRLCESMADKGVIYAKLGKNGMVYHLVPVMPGVLEFPFMGGENSRVREHHDELAALWSDYAREAFMGEIAASPTTAARIIPTHESVEAEKNLALPYDCVGKMLEDVEVFGVGSCPCRQMQKNCDHELETCFVFDDLAEFLIGRNIVRRVSREETMEIIRRSEAAGLMHITNNAADKIGLLCNCCGCCCFFMEARRDMGLQSAFSDTRWVPEIDAERCSGCGICARKRCKFGAISIENRQDGGTAVLATGKCIGCGLCVTTCPEQAIAMVLRKADLPRVPKNRVVRSLKIADEKDRLKDFVSITSESKLAYYLAKGYLFFNK